MAKKYKKKELKTFAKNCAYGLNQMLNGVCTAEEVVLSEIGRDFRNADNEALLLEVSKLFAKEAKDQMAFDVENGAVQEFQYLIERIVECCEENNWFEE